jgi:hypothetical protein
MLRGIIGCGAHPIWDVGWGTSPRTNKVGEWQGSSGHGLSLSPERQYINIATVWGGFAFREVDEVPS